MKQTQREFTGRHMLFLMLAFFGVVIVVNATLAVMANSSWTGMVVKNSYVASQEFNERVAEGRAQAALGWKGRLTIGDGKLAYRLTDAGGSPVRVDGVTVLLRRPTDTDQDQELSLAPQADGGFAADVALGDGIWIVEIDAEAGLSHPYRDMRRVVLRNGALL